MRGAATPNLDRLASEGMRFVNYYGQATLPRLLTSILSAQAVGQPPQGDAAES